MANEFFDKLAEQTQKVFAPVQEWNVFVANNMQKLATMQAESMKSYSEIYFDQVKNACAVSDPKQMQEFLTQQADVAKSLGEKWLADAQAFAAVGTEMSAEARKLAEKGLKATTAGAKKAA